MPLHSTLAGKRIVLVGKLGSMSREAARAVIRDHGGRVTDRIDHRCDILVVGDEADATEKSRLESVENDIRDGLEVVDEFQFWQQLGMVEDDIDLSRLYTPSMLAELLRVPVRTIRRWHRRGLIRPVRQIQKLPYFDYQEIASARMIARLVQQEQSPDSIERQLASIAASGNRDRSLSQLSIIVEGKHVLLKEGQGLLAVDGQQHFNFAIAGSGDDQTNGSALPISGALRSDAEKESSSFSEPPNFSLQRSVIPVDSSHDAAAPQALLSFADAQKSRQSTIGYASPERLIELAIDAEDDGDIDSAIEFYRMVSLAEGPSADISFRLAELLYQLGDLTAARERYYGVIELDEGYVEARASLGCVLAELGCDALAIAAFQGALDHHPDFPDVHYHMARLLDQMGRQADALLHWEAFLQLAPKSPWAEEAREAIRGDC